MVPPWLAENPRVGPGLAFGREQQFVVDPDGIPELSDMLAECPRHRPTPLYALPALAPRWPRLPRAPPARARPRAAPPRRRAAAHADPNTPKTKRLVKRTNAI